MNKCIPVKLLIKLTYHFLNSCQRIIPEVCETGKFQYQKDSQQFVCMGKFLEDPFLAREIFFHSLENIFLVAKINKNDHFQTDLCSSFIRSTSVKSIFRQFDFKLPEIGKKDLVR